MGKTMIQKIFENHSNQEAKVGEIINIDIDVRIARDFGGANVVNNVEENDLTVDNPKKTFFTFDCNPGGCDQKYVVNQHICRVFARKNNIKVFDINLGIGTHLVIDESIAKPGETVISTDSHANILGAIGAFGQGMGDKDIAHAWAHGKVWFKVPPTIKIVLKNKPPSIVSPKDVALIIIQKFGANGLLGFAAEIYGEYIDSLSLDGRITIASMATEMGGIIILFPTEGGVFADENVNYEKTVKIDIQDIEPMISKPGHPENAVGVKDVAGTKIDSGFIGSCTNGRIEDMRKAAKILKGSKIAPGRILKIVPTTDKIWVQCLKEGLINVFKDAGVLIGSPGCAGCANGQIGQTGIGEIAISSGNRNFLGKQGEGDIYLASPATVAASLIAGHITTQDDIPNKPVSINIPEISHKVSNVKKDTIISRLTKIEGKTWVIKIDNIDTDMIFHNRYLSITDINEMGQYTFDNLKGYENFSKKAKSGDIVIVGKNFGSGSSRQQAVDCFKSLGISLIIAESFGAIYERNAINSGMPILLEEDIINKVKDQDEIIVDILTGEIVNKIQGKSFRTKPFSKSQLEIYKRGGLLKK
jgi:3-isopropylmalate dehydratase small subunit